MRARPPLPQWCATSLMISTPIRYLLVCCTYACLRTHTRICIHTRKSTLHSCECELRRRRCGGARRCLMISTPIKYFTCVFAQKDINIRIYIRTRKSALLARLISIHTYIYMRKCTRITSTHANFLAHAETNDTSNEKRDHACSLSDFYIVFFFTHPANAERN